MAKQSIPTSRVTGQAELFTRRTTQDVRNPSYECHDGWTTSTPKASIDSLNTCMAIDKKRRCHDESTEQNRV